MLAFANHGPTISLHKHLGRAGAGVVVGGHREAVGSGSREGEKVPFGGVGEVAVLCQEVTALANRTDEVGVRDGAILSYGAHLVVGVVEARGVEVGHGGVGAEEVLDAAAFAGGRVWLERARVR